MGDDAILHQYLLKLERQKFAFIVYCVTVFFLVIAILQWMLFNVIDNINKFFSKHYWIGVVFFVIGILLILLFIFFEDIRITAPLNWIIAFLIVESLVIGFVSLVVCQYQYQLALSFAIWSVVLFIFLFFGSIIPHDFTVDIITIVLTGAITFIGAVYFLMLYLILNVPYSFFMFRVFMLSSVLWFIMYHAQIINGGRFAEIRDHDLLLGALLLFFDFLFMYLFTFQLGYKWSDECDKNKGITKNFVLDYHLKVLPIKRN